VYTENCFTGSEGLVLVWAAMAAQQHECNSVQVNDGAHLAMVQVG
jgi:hypothetical protein